MAATTPRRSMRVPHAHTPKMSERKKGLFLSEHESSRESLTKHRHLPVVHSESDSEDCDLGIISTLDSSSGEETDQNVPKTPEQSHWHETRHNTKKIKENHDFKNFMKSPFTLKKYQTRYSSSETRCTGSLSTPVTPHLQNHPRTPSSTHSCASIHTTSSTSSRARKSLASLIADTESCSSSLKDLNFDTDSGTDSKENTPSKSVRRSGRKHKMTPKLQSFKGILMEQKKNVSPIKNAVVCLTKMDMSIYISPTQMLKTPHNSSDKASPPKLSHNRRSVVEIQDSPESFCESEKSHKRLHYDNMAEVGPISKHPRLDNPAPKARLSLFNSDRLKEILSTKSFYGKSNPEMNTSISTKISNAIEATNVNRRHSFGHSHSYRRKRKPGQINSGVKHKIRKPKVHKTKIVNLKGFNNSAPSVLNQSITSNKSFNKDISILSQSSTDDKADPFNKEKQTIEALLSQWTEEDIPESELTYTKPQELPCFNSTVIEATDQLFQPITAVPVATDGLKLQDSEAVIVELGTPSKTLNATNLPQNERDVVMEEGHSARHGEVPESGQSGRFLPVEGGYIFVEGDANEQREIPDLDEIERELQMLDEQILKMAENNNMDPRAVLACTDTGPGSVDPGAVLACTDTGPGSLDPGAVLACTDTGPGSLDPGAVLACTDTGPGSVNPGAVLTCTDTGPGSLDPGVVLAGTDTGPGSVDPEVVQACIDTAPGTPHSPDEHGPLEDSSGAGSDRRTKLFPIFSNPDPGLNGSASRVPGETFKKSLLKNVNNQYVIDAGQKKFGATQCRECGVIYQIGDPQDEHDHLIHHNATDVLKFNGWKEECVVDRTETGRCLKVRGGESGWKRVETVLERVVHPQLGYSAGLPGEIRAYTAYLYIEKKQIVGCLIMEPKSRARRLLPGDPDCCSEEQYPVKCGVSRVWTHRSRRRLGVAARLLECARASLLYGGGVLRSELAFSAPTDDGKALAASYCGTARFYVYLD